MVITNMTNDQWAILKGFSKFLTDSGAGYVDKNLYPPAATLDLFRDRAKGLMDAEIRGTSSLSAASLMDLEFRMVELMIDEEQGRETEDGRPIYIPRDYMFTRDRTRLSASGSTGFTRGIGH